MYLLQHEREADRDDGHAAGQQVSLYVQRGCSFCAAAQRLLQARAVAFRAYDITDDSRTREELSRRTGLTLPQIFIDDEPIGGFDGLQRLDRDGRLRALAPTTRKDGQ